MIRRLLALAIAVIGLAALIAQSVVTTRLTGGASAALWQMAAYFTVLTNIGAAATFGLIAVTGRQWTARWHGGLTLAILTVGVIYHSLLAGLWQPAGLAWWADQGLHTATPALVALYWVALAPKSGLVPRHAALWLAWPLAYCAWALARGAVTGAYPYPFIEVATLGPARVAVNIAGLSLTLLIAGLIMVALARSLTARAPA